MSDSSSTPTPEPSHPWPRATEDHPRRWLVCPLLLVVGILFAWALSCYYAGAHGGTDQNGYLVTTRLMLQQGHMGFVRSSLFQFAGRMTVLTPEGWIFAKYPFGYPILALVGRWLLGLDGMYLVNPVCTLAACLLSFFLFRRLVGNFASLMGVIWLMCNPVTLMFAHDANSHAPTLLCVVLGAWGLFTWWEQGTWWRGLLGGLAMGYACTIRYTEFLLVLPVLFVALARMDFNLRKLPKAWPLILGWSIPIIALAIVLWVCYGAPWRTGYSLCKEQTGFGWEYFIGNDQATPPRQGNWQTLLFQLNHTGLFLLWPVCIAGVIALFWHSWRLATAIALWVIPSTILYLFYYWAPAGEETVSYLRFFLTVFPGLILAGLWLLDRAVGMSRAARALCLGAMTVLGCTINLANISPALENQFDRNLSLRTTYEQVNAHYPKGNVIFAEEDVNNELDVAGGWQLYDLGLFRPGAFTQFKKAIYEEDFDDPFPIQRTRYLEYLDLLGIANPDGTYRPKPQSQVDKMQLDLVEQSLNSGKRVAFIFRGPPPWDMLPGRRDLHLTMLASWQSPPPPAAATGLLTRWRKGVVTRPRPAGIQSPAQRKQRTWTLYEVTRDPATTRPK